MISSPHLHQIRSSAMLSLKYSINEYSSSVRPKALAAAAGVSLIVWYHQNFNERDPRPEHDVHEWQNT